MKDKKSLRDSINNLKQDNFPYDDVSDLQEEVKPKEGNYTLEELKKNLFTDYDLEEVVGKFNTTDKNTSKGILVHTTIDSEASHLIGLPPGQYIGIGQGSALNNSLLKEKMAGAPRGTVEKSQVYTPLLRIENKKPDSYSQADLITSIVNNEEVTDLREIGEDWLLTGVNEVTQLSIINKREIISRIEETLEHYDKLAEPKEVIQHYIKLKDMLPEPSSKMVYCELLNKCVMVLD